MLFGIEPTAFGMAGVLTAAAVVFFSYTGFEAVANLGEETRKPSRDLPLGLLGTLGICTVLYIGVALVLTGMVDYREINEGAPIASAFESVGAHWAANLISVAAVAGLTSVILVDIVAMGRIGFSMGRDRLLPPAVAKVHPKWGTPYRITGGHGRPRHGARRARAARRRWPTWSASARSSRSSSCRSRCRSCDAPGPT